MKTRFIHGFVLLMVITMLLAETAWGGMAPAEMEQALLDRINGVRRDPVAAAISIGVDPILFAKQWPELQNLPEGGMPALVLNDLLSRSARDHNEDMLSRGYVDRVTPEGLTVGERIAASGYWPVMIGESIGLVGFANYLPPEVAVSVMFDNMLREELLNRAEGRWNILNPGLSEVGVAVGTGVLAFGGGFFNIYIAVCDFGQPYRPTAEEDLFVILVNQARSNPAEFIGSVGVSKGDLMPDLQEDPTVLALGMPPLFPNQSLFEAARAHALDMFSQGYFSSDSLDGRTLGDRIAEAGYVDAVESGEMQGLLALCGDRDPEEQVKAFFQRAAITELTRKGPEERLIFNPHVREAGAGFTEGICEPLGGICGDYVGLVVAAFGMRTAYDSGIVGVAFRDLNMNGLFDPGEGVANLEIEILREDMDCLGVFSGSAGGFSAPLREGIYGVRLPGMAQEDVVLAALSGVGESAFIRVSFAEPPVGEAESAVEKGLDN